MEIAEPKLVGEQGGFLSEMYKNISPKNTLIEKDLNDRQLEIVKFVKENKSITNKEYRKIFSLSRETASRDLRKLEEMGILINSGKKGIGSIYILK